MRGLSLPFSLAHCHTTGSCLPQSPIPPPPPPPPCNPQILLTSKGISLNPITSLYYVAPTCFVCLSVPWFFVERPLLQPRPLGLSLSTGGVFLGNCTAAFALNLAVFLLIGKTSALTMNVAGQLAVV